MNKPLCTRACLLIHSDIPFPKGATLSVDSITITANGKQVRIGYAETNAVKYTDNDCMVQMKEPDYGTFPDMLAVTKEDLDAIQTVDEIVLQTGDDDFTGKLHITQLTFVLPYEDFKNITVPQSAMEGITIETIE